MCARLRAWFTEGTEKQLVVFQLTLTVEVCDVDRVAELGYPFAEYRWGLNRDLSTLEQRKLGS